VPNRKFGDVKEYNEIAAKVMKENGIAVDDLNAHMAPEFDRLHNPNDLHYGKEGYEFLGKQVAAEIEKALPKK
jgi:acyl-CoA thioesterase-1